MEPFIEAITREHRGFAIDGYALVLFCNTVSLGADHGNAVDIPLRGALLRRQHCEVTWAEEDGYVIARADKKAEIHINGKPVSDRYPLQDGDIVTLGRSLQRKANFLFRIPVPGSSTAIIELPVHGPVLDLSHVPSVRGTRHIVLLRDIFTIGHETPAHITISDFPCCTISFRWFERELIAEGRGCLLGNQASELQKLFLKAPSTLLIRREPCIHLIRNTSARFWETCDLHFTRPLPKIPGDTTHEETSV